MTKCIVHVGMNATGAASIQQSLSGLDDARFLFPQLHETANHSAALVALFATDPARAIRFSTGWPGRRRS